MELEKKAATIVFIVAITIIVVCFVSQKHYTEKKDLRIETHGIIANYRIKKVKRTKIKICVENLKKYKMVRLNTIIC